LGYEDEPGTILQRFVTTGEFVVVTGDGTFLVTDWEADSWTPEEGTVLSSPGDRKRVDQPRE
jgi:hypothetical protein